MYSHGLEKIYAFENINPKSVKTVVAKEKKVSEAHLEPTFCPPIQLTLDLGALYQEALPSFRLQEPISSLGLSAFAAKVLQTKDIHTCDQACHFLVNGSHKGLGQSHIEEIEAKTTSFLGKNPFLLQKTVDWQSLVRISCQALEATKRYCLLARYGLEEHSSATSVEIQEVSRLSHEQVTKLINQAQEQLQEQLQTQQSSFIESALHSIADAYIKPWLKYRHGFAPATEIYERLFQISHTPKLFWQTLEFLRLFGEPIKLIFVQEGIYASDEATLYDYTAVEECAKSYFYTQHTSYPLSTLIRLVTTTLALQGEGLPDGFIEKVLMHSTNFMIDSSHNSRLAVLGI